MEGLKVAECCRDDKTTERFIDPIMGFSHTQRCIEEEINFLKGYTHPDDVWGKKHGVDMTIADRIKQLKRLIIVGSE